MENLESKKLELEELIQRAKKMQSLNMEFWIKRNIKNRETGEVVPGNLEKGWTILNIDSNGLVTMGNMSNDIFHVPIRELQKINPDLFDLEL